MEERFADIEARLAWQEDLLDTLNATVAMQQQQIDRMDKICEALIERLAEVQSLLDVHSPVDEAPPHY